MADMKKITIMNQVTVYQDLFSDEELNLILSEINKSDQSLNNNYSYDEVDPDNSAYLDKHGPQPKDRNDGTIIQTWAPWYTYGTRSIWGYPKSPDAPDNQSKGFNLLKNAILKVHYDYLNDYAESGVWTYPILDWKIGETEEDSMVLSTIEILKHKKNNESKYTIGVHTDWHNHRSDEPGPKQILTYTIYINDDYEGGEIDFIDESNEHLIVYKPKRGDITVFPAGRPYWHGARAATSDVNKIFIRTFAIYRHPMTEKWSNGLRVYGPTQFLEIENERLKSIVDSGSIGRQAVRVGSEPDKLNPNPAIFYNKETYIDGRL
jgi:hypothetical protein